MDKTLELSSILVRRATVADSEAILRLVQGLAVYEKLPVPDHAAQKRLLQDLFSPSPRLQAFLGEQGGIVAGYAFYFETYSSFLALPTLFLEDLFVLPEFRGKKLGYALFKRVVQEAHARGYGRMEWMVLDWNQLAIDFYRRLGGSPMTQWQLFRLTPAEMAKILDQQGECAVLSWYLFPRGGRSYTSGENGFPVSRAFYRLSLWQAFSRER
jgi:GNAT superfamily N-acetyltransferase